MNYIRKKRKEKRVTKTDESSDKHPEGEILREEECESCCPPIEEEALEYS